MERRSIDQGTWYYFTVDLNFEGYAAFRFERYVQTNDRAAALVTFLEPKYFSTTKLLLLPYSTDKGYFAADDSDILSVWTFDGSNLDGAEAVDLKAAWPSNILDKAAITPSRKTAERWTGGKSAL
jgi:hypothetical protein